MHELQRKAMKREVDYSMGLDKSQPVEGLQIRPVSMSPDQDFLNHEVKTQAPEKTEGQMQHELNMKRESVSPMKLRNHKLAQLKTAVNDNNAETTIP